MTSISGTVLLQGRTNHSGVNIFVSEETCATANAGEPVATTGVDGHFEVTLPGETDYGCLQAVHTGYLNGQQSLPAGDLGSITLPGGEFNGDQLINIFDLAIMAGRYDTADAVVDINTDGWVDILDLIIAAGNYDRVGPVSDWE
jgi:hypothetical protein